MLLCVCRASVVRRMTLSKDFSLIIGYLIATFTFKFGPLNIVMCCLHTCAGSRSRGSYVSSGSLECEAVSERCAVVDRSRQTLNTSVAS